MVIVRDPDDFPARSIELFTLPAPRFMDHAQLRADVHLIDDAFRRVTDDTG